MAQTTPQSLSKFTISQSGEGFTLHIEDNGGGKLDLSATAEQLDLIAEAVDALLGQDDSLDEVNGEDDDEDELEDDDDD